MKHTHWFVAGAIFILALLALVTYGAKPARLQDDVAVVKETPKDAGDPPLEEQRKMAAEIATNMANNPTPVEPAPIAKVGKYGIFGAQIDVAGKKIDLPEDVEASLVIANCVDFTTCEPQMYGLMRGDANLFVGRETGKIYENKYLSEAQRHTTLEAFRFLYDTLGVPLPQTK